MIHLESCPWMRFSDILGQEKGAYMCHDTSGNGEDSSTLYYHKNISVYVQQNYIHGQKTSEYKLWMGSHVSYLFYSIQKISHHLNSKIPQDPQKCASFFFFFLVWSLYVSTVSLKFHISQSCLCYKGKIIWFDKYSLIYFFFFQINLFNQSQSRISTVVSVMIFSLDFVTGNAVSLCDSFEEKGSLPKALLNNIFTVKELKTYPWLMSVDFKDRMAWNIEDFGACENSIEQEQGRDSVVRSPGCVTPVKYMTFTIHWPLITLYKVESIVQSNHHDSPTLNPLTPPILKCPVKPSYHV